MKKRRELDALVSNGKTTKRTKSSKKRGHELLRSESDSSEEEFALPAQKSVIRTRGSFWKCPLCSVCVPICIFILVTICLLLAGALIWMQLSLRRDIEILRRKVISVQSGSESTPDQLQSLHTKITEITNSIEDEKSGLTPLSNSIININKQLKLLNSTTKQLSQGLAAAPELKNLPKQFKQITKDIATFENNIATVKDDISKFKSHTSAKNVDVIHKIESLKKIVETLKQNQTKPSKSNNDRSAGTENHLQKDIDKMNDELKKMNSTFDKHVSVLTDLVEKQQKILQSLVNNSNSMSDRIHEVESWHASNHVTTANQTTVNVTRIVSEVLDRLSSMNKTQESDKETHEMTYNDTRFYSAVNSVIDKYMVKEKQILNLNMSEFNSSLQRFKMAISSQQTSLLALKEAQQQLTVRVKTIDKKLDSNKPMGGLSHLSLENIRTRKELQTMFNEWDRDHDGKINVSDIRNVNLTTKNLTQYDKDNDGYFTINEIANAFNLTAVPKNETLNPSNFSTTASPSTSFPSTASQSESSSQTATRGIRTTRALANPDLPPLYKVVVPGIENKRALENAFDQWKPFTRFDNFVTYHDIERDLGALTPPKRLFKIYDLDHNDKYSLDELMMAFGLKELPQELAQGRTQIKMQKIPHRRRKRSIYRLRNRIPL
ncbi:uncharacterized protein LOC141900150 isoform X2 [Tubulanus polymorphus]|uniref:uncharacterized protein LOC141900150 isoform X2 n=1 Tax=Tubulanus polymorphus TaxID=672921 RepID=UPI003DA2C5E1